MKAHASLSSTLPSRSNAHRQNLNLSISLPAPSQKENAQLPTSAHTA